MYLFLVTRYGSGLGCGPTYCGPSDQETKLCSQSNSRLQQSNDEFLREMNHQQVCVSGVEWVGVCGQCGVWNIYIICVCVGGGGRRGPGLYLEHCTFCHSPVSEELCTYMQC